MGEKSVVSVRDLRENLASYLTQASHGKEVVVTSHGKEIAKLVAAKKKLPLAKAYGAGRGQIVMSPDFDETPQDLIDAMEGRDE
jgi:prevent-host-death family protein